MYLQEGRMIFMMDIETLRKETEEDKLGKAIAKVMRGGKKEALWINEVLLSQKNRP